ncbi:hypothetical protein Ancab_029948 [Ancistrocladus abbreviatus]
MEMTYKMVKKEMKRAVRRQRFRSSGRAESSASSSFCVEASTRCRHRFELEAKRSPSAQFPSRLFLFSAFEID